MELYEFNRLNERMLKGEMIEFENESDVLLASFNRGFYTFSINAKHWLRQKSFRTFRDKLVKKVEELNLKLSN